MTNDTWIDRIKNNKNYVNKKIIVEINRTSEEIYNMYTGSQQKNAGTCSNNKYRSAINGEEGDIENVFAWLHSMDGFYLPISETVFEKLLEKGTCQLILKEP